MLIFGPDLLFGFLPPEIEKLYLHRCRSMCLLKSLWFKFLGPNSLNNCCLSKSQCTIPSWHGWFLKKKDGSFEAPRFYPLKAWVAFLWGGQSSREINAAILNSEVPWEPWLGNSWSRWVLAGFWGGCTCHGVVTSSSSPCRSWFLFFG